MAEVEVEEVLREIRERVRAESPERERQAPHATTADGTPIRSERSAIETTRAASVAGASSEATLATSDRAGNRLAPLVSYRTCFVARLELWVKGKIKRASHWFTWEQVNFNSSVYHALRDVMAALSALDQRLAGESAEVAAIRAETATIRGEVAVIRAELGALRQSEAATSSRLAQVEARLAAAEARAGEIEHLRAQLSAVVAQLGATGAAIAALENELRERSGQVLDEFRVCFKQLSLEAGEAAITQDRGRRQLETRIDALEEAVNREP
jgi:hypothetical protein